MKRLVLLLFIMSGIISTSVHAMTLNLACADAVMAGPEEEDEEEPDCD